MSTGRAIITTDAPGCRTTIIDGENGFVVKARSVESLVEAMKKFLVDKELLSSMGNKSYKIVQSRFDVNKINQDLLKFLELDSVAK